VSVVTCCSVVHLILCMRNFDHNNFSFTWIWEVLKEFRLCVVRMSVLMCLAIKWTVGRNLFIFRILYNICHRWLSGENDNSSCKNKGFSYGPLTDYLELSPFWDAARFALESWDLVCQHVNSQWWFLLCCLYKSYWWCCWCPQTESSSFSWSHLSRFRLRRR
jgi:hypothetical protein